MSFPDCPWMLAHEEQAQEALADPSYRCRQTETQTAHSDSLGSGNFGNQNSYIFQKKKEQILASLLQKQELTKTVTSYNHFLISVLRSWWVPQCSVKRNLRTLAERKEEKGERHRREEGGKEGIYIYIYIYIFFFFTYLLFIWLQWILVATCGIFSFPLQHANS